MAKTIVEFARELKQQVPIDQLVSDYVPSLKRSGKTLKGLCPFHEEKTPSFHVSVERAQYHCFGCGAHGDIFRIVQEKEKVDFVLAVERVAKRFGIALPEFRPGQSPEERDKEAEHRRHLLAICRLAEEFFFNQLWNTPGGEEARKYLMGRGLTAEAIRNYRLGLAPDAWEGFLTQARRHGYNDELAAEAGLAVQRDRGGYMDRFRNRIMFPIADTAGDVVAFGGRIRGGEGPKYLNSSDTPLFHKGKLLYGISSAAEAIKAAGRKAVLLEGYMDWIALHSEGIGNVVAGLGTAFGRDQAKLLSRMAGEVILLYDGDEAGRKARYRNAEFLIAEGIDTRVAEVPEGHDPDSFIRAEGSAALREILEVSRPAIEHFLDHALTAFPCSRPEGKEAAVEFLAPLLRVIPKPVIKESYLRLVADQLGLRLETLERALRNPRAQVAAPPVKSAPAASASQSPQVKFDQLECRLLHLLASHPERWELWCETEPDLIEDDALRGLFSTIHERAARMREGEPPPEDWTEVCETEMQIEAMSYILFFDELHVGGKLRPIDLKHAEGQLAEEWRYVTALLRRRRGKRLRTSETMRLRRLQGGFAEHREDLPSLHEFSRAVRKESHLIAGHEAES